jgi:uncharacterized RDD family membrane protein YckC
MTTIPPEPPTPSEGDDDRPPAPPTAPNGPTTPPPQPGGYDSPPAAAGGYGAQPGYGAPQPGYGQPAYGQPAYGQPGVPGPGPGGGAYADWPKRVLSALIDSVGPFLVAGIFYSISRPLGSVVWLAALAWGLYNAYLGGESGQSYGKKVAGTRLVSEVSGQPIGGGLGIGRYFVHILDSIPCYLGYLWPLWDSKRQTFADKILKTVVVPV